MHSPEDQFSDLVAGITSLLATRHDGLTVVHAVISACAEVLGTDAAGVLITDPRGGLAMVAASDERARFAELLQVHTEQGPCRDCIVENALVSATDLRDSGSRWPVFADAALAQGLHAVFAFPMRLLDDAVGGLNLFFTTPTELSDRQRHQAQALTDLAVLGLTQERDQRRLERLAERSLTTLNERAHVNQAIGILAGTAGIDPDTARDRLAAHSITTGQSLLALARAVTGGSLDARELAEFGQ
ncbi:GAF and ANTAR domain-containing protein [Amycolatopsis magusensis]|uniref:Transcriptional regulator with GAF, ATPase, and Fis domain n=1 Tax=Amycolatopsis magusensis TaxID=882444 RepID=A0ABS4Q1N7_9PSEU|nr:GAF and ANTAR domain-containing protein [Amycolatopsis magusensis]MBP2185596.1 transcriptional regulator with GAF, ATPase, and Fis domain [Amycolatopsis magusensis]